MKYSLYIVIIPFFLFFFLGLTGTKLKPIITGIIGTVGMGICSILSYATTYLYFFKNGRIEKEWMMYLNQFQWLHFNDKLHIDLGILLDPISVMMLTIITTISLMVHIYSLGYMNGENGFQRYYALLSLFSFSMLGLVVATNIFQMYIFWELVGVSSYLLIGFYYTKQSAVAASKKAFIITRFADLGFLIGILLLSFYTKTFDFSTLTSNHAQLVKNSFENSSFLSLSVSTWTMGLIFVGSAGKSAMFPLHVWLPDAMEGPTPVSALIHAATMVAAGVYLTARLFPIYFFITPEILKILSFIGAFTAFFASIIAITQSDIKRILAFSTISQIAYMMASIGVSGYGGYNGLGYVASMFHLFTHAFFKALLFLGAGSIIHAVHSNDMKYMGNLYKKMKITNFTFLIACLSISGIPPFSGFYSKDEILVAAFQHQPIIFYVLLMVVGLTSFYIFRLYFCIFWNSEHKHNEYNKLKNAPISMIIPLVILSIFSIFSGLIPFSKFISSDNIPLYTHSHLVIASLSIILSLSGIIFAFILYFNKNEYPNKIAKKIYGLYTISLRKFYVDEVWIWVTHVVIFQHLCIFINLIDKYINNIIDSLALIIQKISISIRNLQSGQTQFYALIIITGSILIFLFVFCSTIIY